MSWRYYKRIPVIPRLVYLNVSKHGVSISIGVRGLRVTIGKQGVSINAGIPGSGLSWRKRVE